MPADKRVRAVILIIVVAAVGGTAWYMRRDRSPTHFTGFVEGEERVIRSEVGGRVLEIKYAEGEEVPPSSVIAILGDDDIKARIRSKEEELSVVDAELKTQAIRVALIEATWQRDVNARAAELAQAEAAAELARRTLARNLELFKKGTSTAQELDESRARQTETESGVARAKELLERARAQEHEITVARNELDTLHRRRDLGSAQLEELRVTHSKYVVKSPPAPMVMETQFLWPGELAQPGTAVVALLDPTDKYVQIYVDVAAFGHVHVGQGIAFEPDAEPGRRYPGEISFIAGQANFTPEKIETRSDRMTQVYRAKVRILEGVERLKPGTEGNAYLIDDSNGEP